MDTKPEEKQDFDVNEKAKEVKELFDKCQREYPPGLGVFLGLAIEAIFKPLLERSSEWDSETAEMFLNLSTETLDISTSHIFKRMNPLTGLPEESVSKSNLLDDKEFLCFMLELSTINFVIAELQAEILSAYSLNFSKVKPKRKTRKKPKKL